MDLNRKYDILTSRVDRYKAAEKIVEACEFILDSSYRSPITLAVNSKSIVIRPAFDEHRIIVEALETITQMRKARVEKLKGEIFDEYEEKE